MLHSYSLVLDNAVGLAEEFAGLVRDRCPEHLDP